MSFVGYRTTAEIGVPGDALDKIGNQQHVIAVTDKGILIVETGVVTNALLQAISDSLDNVELSVDNIDLTNATIKVDTQEIEDRIGPLTVAKEIDPDAASASSNAIARGVLEAVNSLVAVGASGSSMLDNADDKEELFTYLDPNLELHRRVETLTVKGFLGTPNYVETFAYNFPGVRASEILLLPVIPSDTDPVVVAGKTYTFQTALTNTDGNVLIGASQEDSIDNLIAAIEGSAGSGTTYAAKTPPNDDATAARVGTGAGTTMVATANKAGIAGNLLAISETFTDVGNIWTAGATVLSGGRGDPNASYNVLSSTRVFTA